MIDSYRKSFFSPCPTNITPMSDKYRSFLYELFSVVKCLLLKLASRSPGFIPENFVK